MKKWGDRHDVHYTRPPYKQGEETMSFLPLISILVITVYIVRRLRTEDVTLAAVVVEGSRRFGQT